MNNIFQQWYHKYINFNTDVEKQGAAGVGGGYYIGHRWIEDITFSNEWFISVWIVYLLIILL